MFFSKGIRWEKDLMHTISCTVWYIFRPSSQESFRGYLKVYIVFVCSECSTYFPEDANDEWRWVSILCMCMYVLYVSVSVYTYVYVCVLDVYMFVMTYVFVSICACLCIYVCVCVCFCVHLCICIKMYTYLYPWFQKDGHLLKLRGRKRYVRQDWAANCAILLTVNGAL